jgi:U3 small nucleolar RNA-associated protein 20
MAAAAAAAASNNDSDSSDDDDEDSDNENQLSFDAEVDVILNSSKSSSSTQSNSSNGKSKQTRIAKSKGVGAWLVSAPREKIDPRDRSATKLFNAVVLPEPRLTGIDQDRRSGSFYKKKKPEEVVRIDIDQVGLGQHGYVMVQFAVSLLHMFLKKNRIRKDIHLEMIDPLIPLLTICCRKAHSDELLLSSLRCICAVANWPLPSLLKYSDTITSQVMSVLIRFGTNATADVAQGCFRTLAVILKNKTWNVKPHQQKVLLSLLQTGAELPKKQKASFELIHTIVAKKIVSIEIYGLMDRLQEVLLESQHDVVRSSCSDILIRYLVNYPLSKKRLEAHLNFFLKNLDFTYESGRISMLSLLRNIVHRFPVPLLNEQSRIIFLPLVLRIANDEAAKVRAQASECIQELFTRCGDEACRKMIDLLMQWLRPRNADTAQTHLLRRTSTQVIGLIAQKRFGLVRSHRKEIVQCFTSILSRAVSCFKSDNDEMSTSLSRASDRDAYHVLTAFQRLIMTNSDLMIPEILKSKDSTIDAIMESMLAPHAWVRLKSSCVLGTIYSKRDPKQVNKCRYFLGKSGTIFELVRRTCRQLMSTMLTEIMSEQIVKNAVFLGQCMFYHPELCYEAASQDVVVEGEENDDNNNDDDETQRHQHKPVRWMFRRMGVLARRGKGQLTHATSIRQQASFRWFAAMSMTLPPNETKDYLPLMLSPLGSIVSASERAEAAAQLTSKVRTKDKRNKKRKRGGEEESEKPRTPHDITVSLGREVLDLLQNRYGDEIYLEAYGNTMKRIKEARASRKRERALEKVMHPDLHAERKRKKHKRENENRKRKIAEMKQRS